MLEQPVRVAAAGAAAAHRGRLSRQEWADLRRGLVLARECGGYSVSVGGVCIALRLSKDGDATTGGQLRRGAGRAEQQQQQCCSKRCSGRSTTTGAPAASTSARPPAASASEEATTLNSKQRRSRERARRWYAARAGRAGMQNEQVLAGTGRGGPTCTADAGASARPLRAAAPASSCVLPMQVEQASAAEQGSACATEGRPPGEAGTPATRCMADSAAARWRRLAAAAVRFSVWRPWAVARAGASVPALVAPTAERRNLLYESVEGRIAVADALVACAEASGRSKRKAEALSDAAALVQRVA